MSSRGIYIINEDLGFSDRFIPRKIGLTHTNKDIMVVFFWIQLISGWIIRFNQEKTSVLRWFYGWLKWIYRVHEMKWGWFLSLTAFTYQFDSDIPVIRIKPQCTSKTLMTGTWPIFGGPLVHPVHPVHPFVEHPGKHGRTIPQAAAGFHVGVPVRAAGARGRRLRGQQWMAGQRGGPAVAADRRSQSEPMTKLIGWKRMRYDEMRIW